jgi:hypothetical protein
MPAAASAKRPGGSLGRRIAGDAEPADYKNLVKSGCVVKILQ